MLTSLIDITPAADRRGANQMRQQLSVGEHFWRGNALVGDIIPDSGATSPGISKRAAWRLMRGVIACGN
jgi:hypothetical protein